MRPTIVTVKHYVQPTNATVSPAAVSTNTIAAAIANTALPVATSDVKEGSIITALYIEMWLKGNGASDADTQFTAAIYKDPGGSFIMNSTDMATMMGYDNKKNIIYATQGVIGGASGGQSVPIVRQWFKIPKGKQRMALKDAWRISVTTIETSLQKCGLFTYKEQQ